MKKNPYSGQFSTSSDNDAGDVSPTFFVFSVLTVKDCQCVSSWRNSGWTFQRLEASSMKRHISCLNFSNFSLHQEINSMEKFLRLQNCLVKPRLKITSNHFSYETDFFRKTNKSFSLYSSQQFLTLMLGSSSFCFFSLVLPLHKAVNLYLII